MWQADTFDMERIELELGWAANLGMNSVRVFLHDLAWECDPYGFIDRIDQFLGIATRLGFSTLLVLLDDCWISGGQVGKQPLPIPGIHNSRWLQSPGVTQVENPETWPRIQQYVQTIIDAFAGDSRVLAWDVYNEPGNSNMGNRSLPLLQKVFQWARQMQPTQPLTAGLWNDFAELNRYQLEASDVISFHHYQPVEHLKKMNQKLRKENRPILCTEYMARTLGSRFETYLPIFREENIGCYNWGLVAGKTQTYFPWNSPEGAPEPDVWFSDILRSDGEPFNVQEIEFIKKFTTDSHRATLPRTHQPV